MKNKYFDEWEFNQALSFIATNPLVAKLKFQRYLKRYPKDYSAYIYYTVPLITLGEFKKAEKILETLIILIESDKEYEYKVNKTSQKKIKLNIISSKLRLLSYQEKYKELYQYYLLHINEIQDLDLDINPLIFYCRKKLGLLDATPREQQAYIFRQIIHYKEEDFLKHIKRHLPNNFKEDNHGIFNTNFPIEEVLTEIKKHLLLVQRLYPYLYVDEYIFKYDSCGKDNNKTVDYFKVLCFHNTNNIITIYPSDDCEELPYIDLNYLVKDDVKTKGLSRIDKFNKRYGIK